MRLIHLIVVASLVIAAVHVYKIKFESTLQAERLAKLGVEIRNERDRIGALRAEWAQLDSPARIQALAQRHLQLRQIDPAQIERLDHLPERPEPPPAAPEPAPAPSDAIALGQPGTVAAELPTGSVPAPTGGVAR